MSIWDEFVPTADQIKKWHERSIRARDGIEGRRWEPILPFKQHALSVLPYEPPHKELIAGDKFYRVLFRNTQDKRTTGRPYYLAVDVFTVKCPVGFTTMTVVSDNFTREILETEVDTVVYDNKDEAWMAAKIEATLLHAHKDY